MKTILYYPTIKIEDGPWLRNAIMYWDKISSIVPGVNYEEPNSIEVEYLRTAEIYEPIYPNELFGNQELCEEFCEQVKLNMEYQCRIRKPFHNVRDTSVHIDKMSMQSMVHVDKMDMVNIGKTPRPILDFLLERRIAIRNCEGAWVNMNSQDADVYMATLAKYLAKVHGNTEIGTDSVNKFYYPYSRKKYAHDMEKQMYLDVALQEILPVPSMDVPIENIIDFKNRYDKSLKKFIRQIEDYQWDLKRCECIEEIQERTLTFQRRVNEDIEEVEELMDEQQINRRRNAIQTLIPSFVETGFEILGARGVISPMETIMANKMIRIVTSMFYKRETEALNDTNAYLFYARKEDLIHANRNSRLLR